MDKLKKKKKKMEWTVHFLKESQNLHFKIKNAKG